MAIRFRTQSHVAWMLVKPRIKPGPADISDLRKNAVVQWQYRNYFTIALIWGIIIPTLVPGYFWGDWRGGYFYAGIFRMVVVHHVRDGSNVILFFFEFTDAVFHSLLLPSTLWLIGWGKAHSMISTRRETIWLRRL